jgi:hypothetical protein
MQRRIFAAFIFLISLSFSILVVSPVQQDVKTGDVIDLGRIGPGQTVSIQVNPIVTEGGIHGIGGQYDYAIAEDLPRGWISKQSKLYQNPLHITITADPEAKPGNYSAKIRVVDEYNGEQLGNVTFEAQVEITYDVMDFNVTPAYLEVGPGQPARFTISIANKGSTSDVFQVSALGPKRWEFKKPVFVPAMTTKTIHYEIVGKEEETYRATVSVVSLASDNIAGEKNVTLFIKPSLIGDYKATNNGVIVFPIFQAPIYALAGLISNLFPN